ncbi:MAG: histidine phosphatase family protein [Caldimonas sp.]
MSIFLIRHGETALNASRTLQPAATPLSPRGLEQARAIARRLAASSSIAAIVSSDMPRAAQTAEAIGAACGLPVIWEPLLHERNYGDLRGRPYDSLGFDPMTLVDAPPAGESAATFASRVSTAFERVLALHQTLDGDLVVVTHGLVIAVMLQSHATLPVDVPMPARLGNTSVTILSAQPPHVVSLADCTRHLDTEAGDDPLALSGG